MVSKLARAAKAWFGAVVAAVAVLELAVTTESDGGVGVTTAEWVRVAGAFVGALAIVYNVSNQQTADVIVRHVTREDPR